MLLNKKFKDKIKSNFFKYFYYFLIISFSTTAILGGILYFYFSNLMQKETIQANNNVLTQLKNSQELILSEIDNTVANVVLDPFLLNYENYYNDRDIPAIRSIQSKIENATTLCDYIDSVYIYYTKGKFVFSSLSPFTPVDEFYDNNYIQELLSQKVTGRLMQSRKMSAQDSMESKQVLSITIPIPVNPNGNVSALAVININPQYLYKLIDYINIKESSTVLITDEQGDIISQKKGSYSSAEKELLSSLSNNAVQSPGYKILNVNGARSIVSYINSDKYKLRLLYIIPLTAVTEKIQIIRNITLLICSLVILLSSLGSFFLSRRVYAPIRKIMSLLNLSSKTKGDNINRLERNETAIIEKSINQLIDNNKSLQSVLTDYKIFQKNKFLQEWLSEDIKYDIYLVEKLKEYAIDLNADSGYTVFSISADKHADFTSTKFKELQNLIYVHISDKFINNVLTSYKGFLVEIGTNEIAAVINFPQAMDLEIVREQAYSLAKQLHSALLQDTGYTFTLGVSESAIGLDKVHALHLQAIAASNYRLVLGNNNIILYENIKMRTDKTSSYPYFIEKDILSSLKTGDRDSIFSLLEKFTGYVGNNANKDVELIRYYFLQLLSSSIKCIYEIDRNIDVLQLNQNDMYTAILKEETIQHMQSHIQRLYDSVLSLAEKKKTIKNKELVQSVISYINHNLSGDLSTERLSEQFFISASTLRKIFKEDAGTTVKDYISDVKMNKAKVLLQDPHIKIADISEEIGYLSVHAFTKAFKLENGKTPGEYRADWLQKLNLNSINN